MYERWVNCFSESLTVGQLFDIKRNGLICHLSFRFYCSVEKKFVFSSRVNDGFCDCCDGSDERSFRQRAKQKTTCGNSCELHAAEEKKKLERWREALRTRESYVAAGRQEDHFYGPDNAFYLVTKKNLRLRRAEYTYEVQLFGDAYQKKAGGEAVLIGRGGQWTSLERLPLSGLKGVMRSPEGKYEALEMGDGRNCPNGVSRKLQVSSNLADAFSCAKFATAVLHPRDALFSYSWF